MQKQQSLDAFSLGAHCFNTDRYDHLHCTLVAQSNALVTTSVPGRSSSLLADISLILVILGLLEPR